MMAHYIRALDSAFGQERSVSGNRVRVARGDTLLDDGEEDQLASVIKDASDQQWTQFCRTMMTSKTDAVSASNALGAFEMTPRRLADLGVVAGLKRTRGPSGRMVWLAVFIPPMTCTKFLKNPIVQYEAFAASMCDYADRIESGEIERDSKMSLSGALAILHRAGPEGLKSWSAGKRFPHTERIVSQCEGVF